MPLDDRIKRTSKFLSYVLRHNPESLDLTLEPGGWVEVDTLIDRARSEGRTLTRSLLEHVIDAGDKTRFALSEDGTRIRANYGHSIDVDLNLEPSEPPARLFHGTAQSAVPSIRDNGLRPQSRQYVHLSRTEAEATRVGSRHGRPVVLIVEASSLHDDGHGLYRSTENVWLVDHVPPAFIEFPPEESC